MGKPGRVRFDSEPTDEGEDEKQYRDMPYTQLREPLVRTVAGSRPASYQDEALDRAAEGFPPVGGRRWSRRGRGVLVLEGHERDELPRPEVRRGAVLGTNNIDSCNRT